MKRISVMGIVLLLFAACNKSTLTKEQAASLIREGKGYPRIVEYDVSTADPVSARKILDAGIADAGMVTVDRTKKLEDAGSPIVHFTDKAQPYLIRIDPKYKNTQVVKVAEADLSEVTEIQLQEDNKKAIVEYTVVYKNINPFSKLVDFDFSKPDTKRATLLLFDTGWKLEETR